MKAGQKGEIKTMESLDRAYPPSLARSRLGVAKPPSTLEATSSLTAGYGSVEREGRAGHNDLEAVGENDAVEQKKIETEARTEAVQLEIERTVTVIDQFKNTLAGMEENLKTLWRDLQERRAAEREEKFQEEKAMGKYAGGGAATETMETRGYAKPEASEAGMFKGIRRTRVTR